MNEQDKKSHFHVSAGLIWKNGKVLIAKRPKGSHNEGLWEFPGGKQEKGESMEDCLKREIEEELDIKVKVDKALIAVDHKYEPKTICLHAFNCTLKKGKPKSLQGQQFRWVYPVDFHKYIFAPPDMKVIGFLSHYDNKEKIP